MRFVRPAKEYEEMNVVIVSNKENLFFLTCKMIQAKQELLVGYSQQYAAKRQLAILQPINSNRNLTFFTFTNTFFQSRMLKMCVITVTSHFPPLKVSRST
jgi:hypothetical protein